MKNYYGLITILLLTFNANAQIINIPDANFKNALVNTICADLDDDGLMDSDVDTNNDSEVDVAEALAAFTLFYTPPPPLQPQLRVAAPNNIVDLSGIEYFTNLKKLDVSQNLLAALDITALSQLTMLRCGSNPLATLNVSNLTNLQYLYCEDNLLANLDVSTLSAIKLIHCGLNTLTSLNVNGLTQLEWLSCNGNQLQQITFGNNTSLQRLYCSDNLFENLDLSDTAVSIVYCDNNPNLTQLFLKNGVVSPFQTDQFPFPINTFSFTGLPALQYVCCDQGEVGPIEQSLETEVNVSFNPYCTFVPGGSYNTVTGHVKLDCAGSNQGINNVRVALTDGVTTDMTYTDNTGAYTFYTLTGTFNITAEMQNPVFFDVLPTAADITFASTGNTQTADFCVSTNGIHHDVEVTIIPINSARPGFDVDYKIIYSNKGNQTESGTVIYNFDDAILDLVSSTPAVSVANTNSLEWNYMTLLPFESREIILSMNLNAPTEIPPVNPGDILNSSAEITPLAEDETTNDNSFSLEQIVVGSIDPNDKMVAEGDLMYNDGNRYLHYTIRFQNVGTAAAENVVIKDMLSDFVDPTKVEVTSSSHSYRSTITEGNKLEFFYDNINLPAESDNEPGSHGYVAFKVKLKDSATIGDVVENQAAIYFDFNFPVITNTTSTLLEPLLSNTTFSSSDSCIIYPNPADQWLTIQSGAQPDSVVFYNNLGQKVKTIGQQLAPYITTFNISHLQSGIYIIEIISADTRTIKRLIKM